MYYFRSEKRVHVCKMFSFIRWVHDYQDACIGKIDHFMMGDPSSLSNTYDRSVSKDSKGSTSSDLGNDRRSDFNDSLSNVSGTQKLVRSVSQFCSRCGFNSSVDTTQNMKRSESLDFQALEQSKGVNWRIFNAASGKSRGASSSDSDSGNVTGMNLEWKGYTLGSDKRSERLISDEGCKKDEQRTESLKTDDQKKINQP